jgi:ribonuclease T1
MAIFLVIPLLGGLLAVTQSADDAGQQQDLAETASTAGTLPRASDLPPVQLDELPQEAVDTLQLIAQGGPFPYSRDGVTFENREEILPDKPEDWYQEYTVPTPGSDDRGARRLVVGQNSEVYYTDDHYETFRELVLG